jgi:hypothetical protein
MSDATPEARDGGGPGGTGLVALLRQGGADGYTWVAAAVGVNSAAGVQLATGEPVMAIGGFNGSDAAQQISAWVAENFTATSVGGATVYDLTAR